MQGRTHARTHTCLHTCMHEQTQACRHVAHVRTYADLDDLSDNLADQTVFLETQSSNVRYYFQLQGWSMFVSLVRLIRMLVFQPELAFVPLTIAKSLPDLLAFLAVFLGVVLLFGVMFVMFFGSSISAFSTLSNSVFTQLAWIVGDIAVDSLEMHEFYAKGGLTAKIFFGGYMFAVFFIMMNLLLAIVINASNAIKQDGTGDKQNPTDSVMYQIVRALKHPFVWNRLRTIDAWLTIKLHADHRMWTKLSLRVKAEHELGEATADMLFLVLHIHADQLRRSEEFTLPQVVEKITAQRQPTNTACTACSSEGQRRLEQLEAKVDQLLEMQEASNPRAAACTACTACGSEGQHRLDQLDSKIDRLLEMYEERFVELPNRPINTGFSPASGLSVPGATIDPPWSVLLAQLQPAS